MADRDMGYYSEPNSEAARIGKQIYDDALHGRRGFRDDQLGIEDGEIWQEIWAAIGVAAIDATTK